MIKCCSFDKKDIEFNDNELRHFANYKVGDTIYFENVLGDIDTLEIMGFENYKYDKCGGFLAARPSNTRGVSIKHLPKDNWHGTSQDMSKGGEIEIVYQGLLWVSKHPIEKTIEYSFDFKDFYAYSDSILGEYHSETLTLNNISLTNYYKVKHGHPEKVTDPSHIEFIYWTDKDGLVAYQNKGGQVWTKKK